MKKTQSKIEKNDVFFVLEIRFIFLIENSQFDAHATLIIDRCFDVDENFAVDIIKAPALALGNEKPLVIAMKGNCRSFLASKTVQRYLDNEWSYRHCLFSLCILNILGTDLSITNEKQLNFE